MQQRVHEFRMNSVDELKLRLIDAWSSQQQNVIDAAINTGEMNREHECMQMHNILDNYCDRVWLTKVRPITETCVLDE